MGIVIYGDTSILQFRLCLLDMSMFQYKILVCTLRLLRKCKLFSCEGRQIHVGPQRSSLSVLSFGRIRFAKSCHRVS